MPGLSKTREARITAALFVFAGSIAIPPDLQGQTISYLHPIGNPQESDPSVSIARDSSGIYIATSETVGKYDATGANLWIRPFAPMIRFTAVATTSGTGVYVAGNVWGTPVPGQEQPSDAFVRRYDPDGNELWTRKIAGEGPHNLASGVAADGTGALVIGTFSNSATGTNAAFLRRYDAGGNEVWTRKLDILLFPGQSIALDASGIYIVGLILPSAGPNGFNTALNKYDFDGLPIWTRVVTTQAYPVSVVADSSGIYVAATDHRANFVRKYDSGGGENWTHTLIGDTSAAGLALDSDSVYSSGTTSLTLPGQCAAGGKDQFVSRYDHDGTEVWTRQFGTYRDDTNTGITVDPGGVYVTGVQAMGPNTPNLTILAKLEKETVPLSEPKPRIKWECVLNAASFLGGALAPGEIVTILGTGIGPSGTVVSSPTGATKIPTLLAGTRVLFDGTPAPLLYVSADQTTAIVPRGIAGKGTVEAQVEYLGARSQTITLPVLDSRIGVFSLNGSGEGQAVAINSGGSVNAAANPADKGSTISVYATGGGRIDGDLSDDQVRGNTAPKLVEPVYVIFAMPGDDYVDDGCFGEVLYAGEIAGSVEGLLRIDLRVPTDLPAGIWTVRLAIGDPYSPYGTGYPLIFPPENKVTVAVR